MKQKGYYALRIRKRCWYSWVIIVVWVALLLFFLENAWDSLRELEPRAALISWIIFFVILGLGILWQALAHRRAKSRKKRAAAKD
ncbi:MAG: hypothetical protein ACETWC_02260 [Acidobacteriota bacterium]